jgi:hypothetical protein
VVALELSASDPRRLHRAVPAFADALVFRTAELKGLRPDEVNPDVLSRLKDRIVTVRKILSGYSMPHTPDIYNLTDECKVIEVTPTAVRLEVLGTGKIVAEPIENIRLSYDEQTHRTMLIVRPR